MLRTIICCLLSVLPILIGGCGASQGGDVSTPTARESTVPLVASVLHTPTPTAQQPPSPIGTTAASTAPHLASYIGLNAYRQSYPDFIVYYDPTLWTFVRNPDGAGPTLESTQVLSCMVLLSMGAMETANVRYKQAGPYRWQISDTIDPRAFLYSALEGDGLSLFFGLRVPDVEDSGRNQECAQLAEDVMGTAAFVSASGGKVTPLTPEPYVYVPPTPYPEAATFRDPSGILSITVPKGWYVTGPGVATILGAQVGIANYDVDLPGRPDDGIYVSISTGGKDPGQTFEQWVANRIELELSPGNGGSHHAIVQDPQPIELAGHSGIGLILRVDDDLVEGSDVVNSMYLPINEGWVLGVSVIPTTSPDYAAAMSMLETLHIADIK